MKTPPYPLLVAVLATTAIALFALSLLTGPAAAGAFQLGDMLTSGDQATAWLIMREIRLPRTLLAAMIGFTLGLSGAAFQGYLRNPLADPGVLGVSGAASLGAVVAIYTGVAALAPLALPALAVAGALGSVVLLQGLAGRGGVLTLILAGAAISSLSGALTSLVLTLSPNPFAVAEIIFWLLGSVTDRSLDHVLLSAPFMIAGWALLALAAPSLNALSLGEDAAGSLGVNLPRTRLLIVSGAAISVGAATAVAGVIGFVGLVVPHILRPFVGHRPARLLFVSGLGGAVLLLAADIFVRIATPSTELRLGVMTALIGAPFFLWLILKARTELES